MLTQHLSYYTPSWQLAYEDIGSSYVEASGHISDSFASQYWGKRHIDDALYRAIDDDDGTADGIYERGFAYLLDNQFSVIGMFDLMDGSAHERLRYDAYGQPTHSYPEDINGDGLLDGFDVFEFTDLFGNSDPRADLDFNGLYEFFDTSLFLDGFGNKPAIGSGRISDDGAHGPGNSLGFMGCRWDPEAGLWLGRNRMYSPEAGRWLQRDPAGYVDGLSMYLFVRGNPLSCIDPMGLCAKDTPEWHHLLPTEVFKNVEIDDLDRNSSEFGIVMEMRDHRGAGGAKKVHDAWNKDWDDWMKKQSQSGKTITAEMVKERLEKMKKIPVFDKWLSSGADASDSFSEWGNLKKNGRADWWSKNGPSLDILTKNRASFSRLAKAMGYVKSVGKVAKPLAVIGFAYAVFVEGTPVAEAGTDAILLPGMSKAGIDEAIDVGQEHVDNSMKKGKDDLDTGMRNRHGGNGIDEELQSLYPGRRTPVD